MNEADASHSYFLARWALLAGTLIILGMILVSLLFIARFIERRITGPARELAVAAEAVAAGRRVYGVRVLTSTLEEVYLEAVGGETD